MTCNHARSYDRWIPSYVDNHGCDHSGYWETRQESTCVDIDLHRWKCTQCGHIGYYSGRARDHFEGRKHDSFIQETNEEYLRGNSR